MRIRRGAREAEGAPLLREYRVKSSIEGSNPSLSARKMKTARVAVFIFLEDWAGGRARLVRLIRRERIRTAEGWPERERGRVSG